MSVRLYVGNLPEDVNRQELEDIFVGEPDVVSLKLITDKKTEKCRGFGFLTVATDEAADAFIEKFNDHPFRDTVIRIELAQPKPTKPLGEERPALESGEPVAVVAADGPPKPRPVKKVALMPSVSDKPKPVLAKANVEAPDEETRTDSAEEEFSGIPQVRLQPPVRRSTQTPAARNDASKIRRERRGTPNSGRREGTTLTADYRDLEEVGSIDPRWAVLLEAKKKLELPV